MPQLRHRPGDLIQNRYEVRKLLGSGSFGTVYGCRDAELDVPVAVKEMHVLDEIGAPGPRDAALAQFRSEATHLSRLRHPNIVSGHYEPHNGNWNICPVCGLDFPGIACPSHGAALLPLTSRHYLVMEYIAGTDLLEAANQNGGRLSIAHALDYGRDVAAALAHVHARGYVHRDIKPENVRLRAEATSQTLEAVLLDFGIATLGPNASGDRYGTQVKRRTSGGGTVGYAPESPDERRAPGPPSDIHAFGMTFYHLLTDKDPTEPEAAREMRQHDPEYFDPAIPSDLGDVIMRCISFDAQDRYANGQELLDALESVAAAQNEEPEEFEDAEEALSEPYVAAPPPPFVFRSGAAATNVSELAALLDTNQNEAVRHLASGELENWLFSLGEEGLAENTRALRIRYREKPSFALEEFAQSTGYLSKPELEVLPEQLEFGILPPEGQRTLDLHIDNPGRGQLFGKISATHPAVSTLGEWSGNSARVPVTFDAFRLRPGRYSGEVHLDSSAGNFAVPFHARVVGPSGLPAFFSVLFWGFFGLFSGALLRILPFVTSAAHPGHSWLQPQSVVHWFPISPLFGASAGVLCLIFIAIEALMRRSCSLFLAAGAFSAFIAITGVVMGNVLLTAGDVALQKSLTPLVGHFAAGGWMTAGAAFGALWGTLRRTRDTFSPRILTQLAGWLAVGVLIAAALVGAKGH